MRKGRKQEAADAAPEGMTARPIRILFVEGDAADREGMERFVRGMALRYDLVTVASTTEAVDELRHGAYDVAVIDYRFTDGTAFDLLKDLGETPAIFLTGTGEEEIAAMVLERGAYDYLMKDASRNYLVLLPATIHKVIARKQAEDALRQSQAVFKDLMDTMLDLYFCVGDDGRILLVNNAGARQLGYKVKELVGTELMKLVHPSDLEKVQEAFFTVAARPGEPLRLDFRQVRKDGALAHVACEMRAQAPFGRQVGVVRLICRDITDRLPTAASARAPAQPAKEAVPPKVAAAPRPAAGVGQAGVGVISEDIKGTGTLLVVDDQADQRAIAARMLTKMGYRVVTADSGKSAIGLMEEGAPSEGGRPFDLILLDMNLEPGCDGLDVYRQMMEAFPGQKCVLLSGCGETDRVREAIRMGCGRLITKPYTFQSLGRAIRDELARQA